MNQTVDVETVTLSMEISIIMVAMLSDVLNVAGN